MLSLLCLEHWLSGYGWIIHLSHRTAAQLCGPCQWLSGGWRAECWERCDSKRSMLPPLTFLHQQKWYTCFILFFYQHGSGSWAPSSSDFFHQQPYCTKKHVSTPSDICWWIDPFCSSKIAMCCGDACLDGIDHLKLLRLRQCMPTAWQQHIFEVLFAQEMFQTRWNCHCLPDETLIALVSFHSFPLLTANMLISSIEILSWKRLSSILLHH